MASVNKVIVLGRLGRDPDLKYTTGNAAICACSVATSRRYKDANGQPKEETEWHRIVFFGRQAELVNQYLRKGSNVYVEGRLRTRKWQGQDGQEKSTTEIIAEQMQFVDGKTQGSNSNDGGFESAPRKPQSSQSPWDEDIAF